MRATTTAVRCAATLLLALAVAGCDPVAEGDDSPPQIVRLVASGGGGAPVVAETPAEIGSDGVARWELPARGDPAAGIPGDHVELRVEFSKPMDGATIEDPAAPAGDCHPAPGIGVADEAGPVAAAVCYDPSSPISGGGAAMVVRPPTQADGELQVLPPGARYRVTATVRDHQGRTLVVNAQFLVAPASAPPSPP